MAGIGAGFAHLCIKWRYLNYYFIFIGDKGWSRSSSKLDLRLKVKPGAVLSWTSQLCSPVPGKSSVLHFPIPWMCIVGDFLVKIPPPLQFGAALALQTFIHGEAQALCTWTPPKSSSNKWGRDKTFLSQVSCCHIHVVKNLASAAAVLGDEKQPRGNAFSFF